MAKGDAVASAVLVLCRPHKAARQPQPVLDEMPRFGSLALPVRVERASVKIYASLESHHNRGHHQQPKTLPVQVITPICEGAKLLRLLVPVQARNFAIDSTSVTE